MKPISFRSNGKLMISGEYLVLAGAEALAVPLRLGQSMTVTKDGNEGRALEWTALQKGDEWFRAIFDTADFQIRCSTNGQTAETLRKLLLEARLLNPTFLNDSFLWRVETRLEFDRHWGLGSSSTLVSNLAWWAGVDPYRLLFRTLGGSGYDLACARSAAPLVYRYRGQDEQALVEAVDFRPPFSGQLFFVYSGEKQSSAISLKGFDASVAQASKVSRISMITRELLRVEQLEQFMQLLREHESITGGAIGKAPVQELMFSDFPGVVKSLGAWGGDFLLAASGLKGQEVFAYFKSRGFGTIFSFDELIA